MRALSHVIRGLPVALAFVAATADGTAWALSGPSPGAATAQTVKLPDFPGSAQGLSDEASVTVFSGQVSYSVPLDLPKGPAGFGPSLALTYVGELGNGPVGIGWTLGSIAIRRSLRHGVPSYTDADELELTGVGDPGRLVPMGGGQFRVEGQGNRIRVFRHGDRFDVTDADGTQYALGATSASREEDGGRIAAWFADSAVNLAGQQITFDYDKDQNQIYLAHIVWAGAAYRLDLVYEGRADQYVSYRTGFAVKCARRLSRLDVSTAFGATPTLLRSYGLSYDETFAVARLSSIRMVGTDRTTALPDLGFTYTRPELAAVASLGNTGSWVLNQRGVSFADVDGDGADDLLRLEAGNHVFRQNLGDRFADEQPLTGASDIDLAAGRLIDLDGDARPELVRIVDDTWRYYTLAGTTWMPHGIWPGTQGVPLQDASTVLCDLNGDGRTDVVRGAAGKIIVYLNGPDGLGAPQSMPQISAGDAAVEPGKDNVRFVDFNGDGLVDVVWLTDAWMKIFLGRGDGTFVVYNRVFYPWGQGAFDAASVQLADLNRDGLMDLVRISGGFVYWYPGDANGGLSDQVRHLNRPEQADADTVVTIADADGNGSLDLVWSSPRGMWVLDLAGPTSAGMLAEIRNGLGKSTQLAYQSSATLAMEAAAQGNVWAHKLPVAIPVVVRTQIDPGAGGLLRVRHFGVRDGFWDGGERRLGGFLQATETTQDADGPGDTLVDESQFHPGLGDDRVLRGKVTASRRLDGRGQLFGTTKTDWQAIAPSNLTGLGPLARRAVATEIETGYAEGVATSLITRTTFSELDSEARATVETRLGLVDRGGDEKILHRTFADDGTLWVRDRLVEETVTDGAGAIAQATRYLYGGRGMTTPLPLGTIGEGFLREVDGYLSPGNRWVTQSTHAYDSCGNAAIIHEGGVTRTLGFDGRCLHPLAETVAPGGASPSLTWTMVWDESLCKPRSVTDPNGDTTVIDYDALARPISVSLDGASPHQHALYNWVAPRPTTTTWVFDGSEDDLKREGPTWPVGPHWRQTTAVSNGAGEQLFSSTPISADTFVIGDWKERDERGHVVRVAEPFYSAVAQPAAPADGTRIQTLDYDAQGRLRTQTLPNGARKTITYRALAQTVASDELGPVSSELDGLLRVAHTERSADGTTVESVDADYDAADRITAMRLQGGAVVHAFAYDTLGRLIHANDPDTGDRALAYDDRNFLVQHTNGVGQSVFFDYDDAGRLVRRGDAATANAATDYVYKYDADPDGPGATCHAVARLAVVQEPAGQVHFCYDDFGRQDGLARSITVPDAPTTSGGVGQTFSPSGLLLTEQFDDGFATGYRYDGAGRVVAISSDGSDLWAAVAIDAAGRVTSERYGNGVTQTYEHDQLGLPSHIRVDQPAGAGSLYEVTVTRNAYGAPKIVTDLDGQGLDHTATFAYDLGGRLVGSTLGQGSDQFQFTFAYDALQNMVRREVSGPKDIGVLAGLYQYGERGYGPRQLTSVTPGGSR